MTCLVQLLANFLKQHQTTHTPPLLAISGGPDSIALLNASIKLAKQQPFPFHVAHVDHKWRQESTQQADLLQSWVQQHNIPFHRHTLNPSQWKGNWEEQSRLNRLAFFKHLLQIHSLQAVILAHHADDQAETVLKRLLEGSSLPNCHAMQPSSHVDSIPIWRPFLPVTKKDLLSWNSQHNLPSFNDPTNTNPLYLRARMRQEILPLLTQHFGKNIRSSLCQLATEAHEIQQYLQEHATPWLARKEIGPFGLFWDWHNLPFHQPALPRYLLQKALSTTHNGPPRKIIDAILSALQEKKTNTSFFWKHQHILVDRSHLFLLNPQTKKLQWTLSSSPTTTTINPSTSNWKDAWKGSAFVSLPKGNYHLATAPASHPFGSKSTTLGKWWNQHRVPSFLRSQIPVLWQDDRVIHEFLSGKQRFPGKTCEKTLCISFTQ